MEGLGGRGEWGWGRGEAAETAEVGEGNDFMAAWSFLAPRGV